MSQRTQARRSVAAGLSIILGCLAPTSLVNAQDEPTPPAELTLLWERPNPEPTGFFGSAVVFVGDDILVGSAETLDVPCQLAGALRFGCTVIGEVRLFDGETGVELLHIENPSPDPVDERDLPCCQALQDTSCCPVAGNRHFYFKDGFGEDLAPFGDEAFLVGAWLDNTAGCDTPYRCFAGRVYLYNVQGVLLGTFSAPDPEQFDNFGKSLATLGDKVIVGAPGADGSNGTVYVFDGVTGELLLEIPNPNKQETPQRFGHAVGARGDVIVIGDPGFDEDRGFIDMGRVYVFDAESGDLVASLRPPTLGLAGSSCGFGNCA